MSRFSGPGTTSIAAMKCGRNSIGVEIEPTYLTMIKRRAEREATGLFSTLELSFDPRKPQPAMAAVAQI